MRILVRSGLLGAALLLASFGGSLAWPHHLRAAASSRPLVSAGDTPHVTIFDSDSPPYNPPDGTTGGWSYAPNHVTVTQGQQIVFDNPASNFQAHTVTSLAFSQGDSGNFATAAVGSLFDSSPTRADRLAPGASWTLDTSSLKPGQYEYFCSAHPWMLGSFTVLPASSS